MSVFRSDKNIYVQIIDDNIGKTLITASTLEKKIKSKIINTPVGNISEPVFLPEGILFFKVRDKRKIDRNIEEEKNQLVNSEKTKILNMHSSSHYDKLRRVISIKFFNE